MTATAQISIDVAAIVANWKMLRRQVSADVAAVVKADCYGLGVRAIAPALVAAGCKTFFVATVEEGLGVRDLIPASCTLFVLGGPTPGEPCTVFLEHGLTPVLNSLGQIEAWGKAARARGRGAAPAALHLDTGMCRLGLHAAEVERLVATPRLLEGIASTLVMSHLACADEPDHPKNEEQRGVFHTLSERLGLSAPRSLGASSGIFLGPAYHFQMVRPGVALYGVNPQPERPNPMVPVVGLRAQILQVRDVDSAMTIGYGASHRFRAKGRTATVGIGYADGLFRSLQGRGRGILLGSEVPMVGRVSMDLTTFDVSALPLDAVQPGMWMELIGPRQTLDDFAWQSGTIGYEILTGLTQRPTRLYTEAP